jgi:hypothetical protein
VSAARRHASHASRALSAVAASRRRPSWSPARTATSVLLDPASAPRIAVQPTTFALQAPVVALHSRVWWRCR